MCSTRLLELVGKAGLKVSSVERAYEGSDGRARMRTDGLFSVVAAWYQAEGRPNRGHRAPEHSYNSINKHAGRVTVRTIEVSSSSGPCAVLYALFDEEDVAWVFEQTDGDDVAFVGRSGVLRGAPAIERLLNRGV